MSILAKSLGHLDNMILSTDPPEPKNRPPSDGPLALALLYACMVAIVALGIKSCSSL
jgi:hypothetical protein